VDRDGAAWLAYFLEQQREHRTNQADQNAKPKTVHVAEQRTLLLEDAVENGERFLRRCPTAGIARECTLEVRELLLEIEIELRHVPRELRLARLCVARDQRRDRGNAYAPANIAHEIKNAGRVTHLFLTERAHG